MSEAENPFETPSSDSASFSKTRSWKRTIAGMIGAIILVYGLLGVVASLLFFGANLFPLLRGNPVYVLRFFALPTITLLLGAVILRRAFGPNR